MNDARAGRAVTAAIPGLARFYAEPNALGNHAEGSNGELGKGWVCRIDA